MPVLILCLRMRVQVIVASSLLALASLTGVSAATLTVQGTKLGSTPGLLAYNSGHFVPGSNTRDWWRYSGVNGARVFITASLIEPQARHPGRRQGVTDQASFLSRRAALRANPLATTYINWPYITNRYGLTLQHGSNLLNVNYACSALRQLGIRILVCISASPGTFPITDANDWAGKWELWQHYYFPGVLSGARVRRGAITRCRTSRTWTASRWRIISAAASWRPTRSRCALADVNQRYGKSLAAAALAPVTAGQRQQHLYRLGPPDHDQSSCQFPRADRPEFLAHPPVRLPRIQFLVGGFWRTTWPACTAG